MSSPPSTLAGPPGTADATACRWVAARRRGLRWSGAGALAALIALWAVEYHGPGLPGQRAIYDHFKAEALELSTTERSLVDFSSALGSPPVALLTVAALAVVLWPRLGGRSVAFTLACAAVVLPEAALNAILGPAPEIVAVDRTIPAGFPSGHVAYATALFGGMATIALMRGHPDVAGLAAAVAVLMGPARVVKGVHLVSDVLAGYALGLAWLIGMVLAVWGRAARPPLRGGGDGERARDRTGSAVF